MRIVAIDPGTEESGWIEIVAPMKIVNFGYDRNEELKYHVFDPDQPAWTPDHLAIEEMKYYGSNYHVGKSVFDTCIWIGRFIEIFNCPYTLLGRKQVAAHITGTAKANDSGVRHALLDRFPATGGGKTPEVGTKSQPGPLYGIKGDIWSALAIGLTFIETMASDKIPGEGE